jgi:4-hydroxy-2-oxoglutarate aldolase
VGGDHPRARRLQAALLPLAVAVTATWGVAGLKGAMDAAGLRGGEMRAPLLPVPAAARAEIAAILAQAMSAAG